MKILIDTNVVLDIVLERQPFVEQAARLLKVAQAVDIEMFLTATTVTDLYYIIRKAKDKDTAIDFIKDLMQLVQVASVDKNVIVQALESNISDFEDAIQENSARNENITIIVTRNVDDFTQSTLESYTPELFLENVSF